MNKIQKTVAKLFKMEKDFLPKMPVKTYGIVERETKKYIAEFRLPITCGDCNRNEDCIKRELAAQITKALLKDKRFVIESTFVEGWEYFRTELEIAVKKKEQQ